MIERFRADLGALWNGEGKLGIALSGGPDSVALLLLAHAAIPDRVEAASVDHQLRLESADEVRFAASVCDDRDIPHAVLPVTVAAGNVQGEARSARYAALDEWAEQVGITAIATGHHADDQAETFLMRLNRGSGVAGLAGIRASGPIPGGECTLIRPLLGWRQSELEAIVNDAGIESVRDPSNQDDNFDRVRLRKFLAQSDWFDVDAITRSAAHMAEAEQAIAAMADREWSECVSVEGAQIVYTPKGPPIIRKIIVQTAISWISKLSPRGSQTAQLTAALGAGEGGNVAGVMANASEGRWIFRAEPPRKTG